jgi:hypothetical protein
MCSIHSAIKMSPFQVYYRRVPRYSYINIFGSIIYYNNPGKKEKLWDKIIRSIFIGYKGNTICRILKPDRRITRGAVIKAIKRIL